jgi:uncharacterized coiled-coil protein SlyX
LQRTCKRLNQEIRELRVDIEHLRAQIDALYNQGKEQR